MQKSQLGFTGINFGDANYINVPANVSRDGKSKSPFSARRTALTYFFNSAANQACSVQFGQAGDKPVPDHFDRDDKNDVCNLLRSVGRTLLVQFGLGIDVPIPRILPSICKNLPVQPNNFIFG